MNLIVSDYDNTLYLHNVNKIFNYFLFKKNINIIKKLRKKNNLFVIATGRYYDSILKEIKKYNLEFDYLICNDGAELYDNRYKLIYCKTIPIDSLNKLLKFNFTKNYSKKGDIISLSAQYDDNLLKQLKKIKHINLDITPYKIKVLPKVNKIDCVKIIESKYEFKKIYTFGDNINDIEMLVNYFGYTVNKKILKGKIKYVDRIGKILKEILIKN